MPIKRFRYFVAVAERKSFSRAASELNVAQSALSRHIADLETAVGARLLDRSPKGVHLTAVGHVLFEDARRLLAQVDRAFIRARLAAGGSAGRLTIGVNELAARNPALIRATAMFLAAHPRVDLRLIAMNSIAQEGELRDRRMDAGAMIERSSARSDLDHLPIDRDIFVLASSASQSRFSSGAVSLDDLRGCRFVTIALDRHWLAQSRLRAALRANGFDPEVAIEVDSERLQLELIAAGVGVGFVNVSVADRLPASVILSRVERLDVALELDLVWLRDVRNNLLDQFIALLRQTIAEATATPLRFGEVGGAHGGRPTTA